MIKVKTDLHDLKDKRIITQKGKGKAIYYVAGDELINLLPVQEDTMLTTQPEGLTIRNRHIAP
jgi:hypothetical protein